MTDSLSRAELLAATGFRAGRDFGELLVTVIGLAAETHPDLLRHALAKVFDLSAAEESASRVEAIVRQAHQAAGEARAGYRQMAADAAKLQKRVESLERWIEELERRASPPPKTITAPRLLNGAKL